ncbi:MAG TPA: DinB family protein [Phototrophicaceae bacterium]|jgi:uncharacterized damage-inducible protein DinB|nr:DinB family protein [Phototrophicaceae bacterium]
MHADQIRELYEYHFSTNRRLWDTSVMTLTDEQFSEDLAYSLGSIHNQCVHLMSIDERWFSGLRGEDLPDFLKPADFPTRETVRLYWDSVEAKMRGYLDALTDEAVAGMLDDIPVWVVLQHVLLHGMDHRAQMLAMLHRLGAPTFAQDLIYRYFKPR